MAPYIVLQADFDREGAKADDMAMRGLDGVVPRSEVLALENEIERLKSILDSYALQYGTVMDQHLVIEKARTEVARKIFAEIEKHRDKMLGIAVLFPEKLAELKKKYTEGKDEQASIQTDDKEDKLKNE